jgi:hypothetical protein
MKPVKPVKPNADINKYIIKYPIETNATHYIYSKYNEITAKQGDVYEAILYDTYLNNCCISFTPTDRFNRLDYIGQTDKSDIFIELKSRNINIDTYPTTIIAVSKIEYFKSISKLNPTRQSRLYLIFAYGYKDDKQFYFIKYEPTLFKLFNISKVFNKNHYDIPTEYLKPIADFNSKLLNY